MKVSFVKETLPLCLLVGILFVSFLFSQQPVNTTETIYLYGGLLLDAASKKIIDEAHKNNFSVVTHATTLEQAKDALKAGTDGLAHIIVDREVDEDLLQKIKHAKETLQKGLNSWDVESMKKARDQFLSLLLKEKQENIYILYYMALCDFRLSNYYLASAKMKEAEIYTKEAQKYLEKAMDIDPNFGELYALYATMLGFEIAFNQDKAMTLGMQIYQYFYKALQKSSDNPRVHYLKGVSDLYTPVEFGGGPDTSIKTLLKSIELFEKEDIQDPVKPSWGEDEAYTFLGMAYKQKGDAEKAVKSFKKALEINPDSGLAKAELNKIEKEEQKL